MKPTTQFSRLPEFVAFVNERWAMHERRQAGRPVPWTDDEILQTYRFCNVRREDDRVTKWIHTHWLTPHATDYDTVVFAMALARLVNLPAMLEVLKYPTRWDPARFVSLMEGRRSAGHRAYNNAYMINAVGATKGQSKAAYLADCVLGPMWVGRKTLGRLVRQGCNLEELHETLMRFHGFGGGFMSGQVVADIKWLPSMQHAADWRTFARSGPGSRRGLNWLVGRDPATRWNEAEWYDTLMTMMQAAQSRLKCGLLDAQNLQNCLCEFSKYCKVKYLGKRAKQKFRPSTEVY